MLEFSGPKPYAREAPVVASPVVAVPALPLVEVTVAFATLSAGFPHPAKRPAAAKITMHRFNCFVFMRGSVYGFFAHIATMSEKYPPALSQWHASSEANAAVLYGFSLDGGSHSNQQPTAPDLLIFGI